MQADVLVAGTRPPLTTTVAWLHANLQQADHFLCIVVHLQPA